MDEPWLCPWCKNPVIAKRTGRPPRWCSAECRRRGHEAGIRIREVVHEQVVEKPERISPQRQIDRLLDDEHDTELLLRTLAHRWRHRSPDTDPETHRRLAPLVLDLWQSFHAPVDPQAAKTPPGKAPSAAADYRLAVEKVLSSPRSIQSVLIQLRNMIDRDQLPGGQRGLAQITSGLAELNFRRR